MPQMSPLLWLNLYLFSLLIMFFFIVMIYFFMFFFSIKEMKLIKKLYMYMYKW